MCLIIKKMCSKSVVECKKYLLKTFGEYETPYRNTIVPDNGWLIPLHKGVVRKVSIYDDKWKDVYDPIEGNFIHAYKSSYCHINTSGIYEAYGIQLVAYGAHDDLICRAMYIPKADKNTRRRKRIVEFLKTNPTKEQIIEKFPFLKEKI